MTTVGRLVTKFQVPGESDSATGGKKAQPEERRPPQDKHGGGPPEPPGGRQSKKPALPGKKPTRVPPGVQMRKQASAEGGGGGGGPVRRLTHRQSSISFTTEDLDLFQRQKDISRRKRLQSSKDATGRRQQDEPASAKTLEQRSSRKDSVSSGSTDRTPADKHRSKSAGPRAPPPQLRPAASPTTPTGDKPKLPVKPKVAGKLPNSLPRPFQAPSTRPETSKSRRASGRPPSSCGRPTSGGQALPSGRPASGTRTAASGLRSRSGSQSGSKGPPTEASRGGGQSRVTSTAGTAAGEQASVVTRARPSSGSRSRPSSGVSQTSPSRPTPGSRQQHQQPSSKRPVPTPATHAKKVAEAPRGPGTDRVARRGSDKKPGVGRPGSGGLGPHHPDPARRRGPAGEKSESSTGKDTKPLSIAERRRQFSKGQQVVGPEDPATQQGRGGGGGPGRGGDKPSLSPKVSKGTSSPSSSNKSSPQTSPPDTPKFPVVHKPIVLSRSPVTEITRETAKATILSALSRVSQFNSALPGEAAGVSNSAEEQEESGADGAARGAGGGELLESTRREVHVRQEVASLSVNKTETGGSSSSACRISVVVRGVTRTESSDFHVPGEKDPCVVEASASNSEHKNRSVVSRAEREEEGESSAGSVSSSTPVDRAVNGREPPTASAVTNSAIAPGKSGLEEQEDSSTGASKKIDVVVGRRTTPGQSPSHSPLGSPGLGGARRAVVKPSTPPPPPPTDAKSRSQGGRLPNGYPRPPETAPPPPSGSSGSSSDCVTLLKAGLNHRGNDLPVCQLISQLSHGGEAAAERAAGGPGKRATSPTTAAHNNHHPAAALKPGTNSLLALRVFPGDHGYSGSSSSETERKERFGGASDSNDADDEAEVVSAAATTTTTVSQPKILVKSASEGSEPASSNASGSGGGVHRERPSSLISLESSSSASNESLKEKAKSKASGVLHKLRKLSRGLISFDDGPGGEKSSSLSSGSRFYNMDGSVEKDISSQEDAAAAVAAGKTVFYRTESLTGEQTSGSTTTGSDSKADGGGVGRPPPGEGAGGGGAKRLSTQSGSSCVFMENDCYSAASASSTAQPYENVAFGEVYGDIEIRRNHAGRNDLRGPSAREEGDPTRHRPELPLPAAGRQQSRDEEASRGPQEEAAAMPTTPPVAAAGSAGSSPSEEDLAAAEPAPAPPDDADDDDDDDSHPHLYDNAVAPTPGDIYENIRYQGYRGRSVWRRKTVRRRQTKKASSAAGGATEEDDDEGEEGFEDFSDSDDSFDSDSFTDSDDEKAEVTPLYATAKVPRVKGEAEEDVPKATRLKRIAMELLTTEKAYVERLHLIDQVFHFQIVLKNRTHHMFPDDVIPQMFSNVKSIYQFHHDFLLPQLQKRMEDWDKTPKIGDLMKKFAPFLKLYSEYVKNFDHGISTINSWQQRSQVFANLILTLQKKPECGMLSLQHHMLEPIQRVPRYKLLLEDYLKHLPEDSEDEPDTKKALELVSTAASHSNETMSKIDKFQKLLELNEKLGGLVDLIDPSRELVKEGKIVKISARNGVHHDRYLFLFNDMLLLCQTHVMGLIHGYRIKNLLNIDGMQVLEGDNLETPFTFYVKSKTKTIELHTSSREEKLDWYVTLENVIADYTRRQMSRLAGLKAMEATSEEEEAPAFQEDQLGYRAPTWVKDQNTSMCMQCGSPFSVLKRRHHCRCCGIVVCYKCSSHKIPLPYQNYKPDRVCDKCFRTLSGRNNDKNGPLSPELNNVPRIKQVLQVKASDPSVVAGYLQLSSDRKNWEKRWFTLHDNFVLYTFKAPQDVHAMTSMPLPGYQVNEATKEDHVDRENVIKLYHSGTKKTYYFSVDTSEHYCRWLIALQCAAKAEVPLDYVPQEKN